MPKQSALRPWDEVEPVPWSSVVGQSVVLYDETGIARAQLSVRILQGDTSRAVHEWFAGAITDALREYDPESNKPGG